MRRLEGALAEALSPSWRQRVRAGRGLAAFADVPEAAEALLGLLLDVEDTAVTRQTAEALARVGSVAAIRLIALAVAGADANQADWLQTGVYDALGPDGVRGTVGSYDEGWNLTAKNSIGHTFFPESWGPEEIAAAGEDLLANGTYSRNGSIVTGVHRGVSMTCLLSKGELSTFFPNGG